MACEFPVESDSGKVSKEDFELLKVLGTGGKRETFLWWVEGVTVIFKLSENGSYGAEFFIFFIFFLFQVYLSGCDC